ncbi:MAG: hypothetical protein R3F59_13305 [Myxococcota bacterium]
MTRGRAALALALAALLAAWALWPRPAPPPAPVPVAAPKVSLPAPVEVVAPPPAPAQRVECQLAEALEPYTGLVVDERDPDSFEALALHEPTLAGSWFAFVPRNGVGVGYVSTPRHAPRAVAWMDGACIDLVALTPLPVRTVRGTVLGQIEVGGVAVRGRCEGDRGGFSGSVPADGRFVLTLPVDRDCTLEVTRVFGEDELVSEPFPIRAAQHDPRRHRAGRARRRRRRRRLVPGRRRAARAGPRSGTGPPPGPGCSASTWSSPSTGCRRTSSTWPSSSCPRGSRSSATAWCCGSASALRSGRPARRRPRRARRR